MSHTVLTPEQVFNADDRQFEFVKVPEWAPPETPDAGIWVRGLSGTGRDRYEMSMIKGRGRNTELNLENLRSRLLILTCVNVEENEDGEPIPSTATPFFTDKDAVVKLGRKSGKALQRLYDAAQRLSGLSAETMDELEKTLGEVQSDGSGSDLLDTSDTEASLLLSEPSAPESSANGSSSTEPIPSETGV